MMVTDRTRSAASDKPRILIMGGTGFLGRELGKHLVACGYEVSVLARDPRKVQGTLPFPATLFAWGGNGEDLPVDALTGRDVIINLVGEGIADKPWTAQRRAAIETSRTESCEALRRAIAAAAHKPKVVIQASAVGYYGDRGEQELTEQSPAGAGFLAKTCVAWERGIGPIEALGVRVVGFRIAMVLGWTGGALPKLIGVYAKGLGAVLGNGDQWMPWIHVDDVVRLVAQGIEDSSWRGVYNASAPHPCRFAEFNDALARCGQYAARKSVPSLAVRAAMGRRSELVLASAKVSPARALAAGFTFAHGSIEAACHSLLGDAVGPNLRRYVAQQWIPMTPDKLWPFFTAAKNLEHLTPEWLSFRINAVSTPEVGEGTRIQYQLKLRGVPITWESEITNWDPGRGFIDEQRRGPYSVWHHAHGFEAFAGGTLMTDTVQYRLPAPPLGELVAGFFVERDVSRIFAHRAKTVAGMEAKFF